jgi:P27 family predicted phage terminase small subunit
MANNKLPAEIHALQGSKGLNMGVLLPEKLKQRIPFAEWASQPELFNKQRFVEETAQYLYDVYGIGTEQDRHTLMMLADQMQTYIDARTQQDKHPLVIKINNGKTLAPNPFISVANEAMKNCIRIMNELGLTPRSRLASGKIDDESPLMHFLKGPLAQ